MDFNEEIWLWEGDLQQDNLKLEDSELHNYNKFIICIHRDSTEILVHFFLSHEITILYYDKNNKNIFNENEGRCRDVKTIKACKQGWEVNVGPKIKQTTSI